jgi:NAD+ synthase
MPQNFTFTLAQLNPTVGDIAGNIEKILGVYRAHEKTSDLIACTEMVVSGYPTEDLVLKPLFIDRVMRGVGELATKTGAAGLLVGAPWREGEKIYNAALLLHEGKIAAVRYKHHLPNYGVFDEVRVFAPGPLPEPVDFKGLRLGVMICEDMWHADVAAHLKKNGAEMLVVPNGSPYELGKTNSRLDFARARVAETGLPLVYINQIGGQDELVFDGASFALDVAGKILTQLPEHREYVSTMLWEGKTCKAFEAPHTLPSGPESIYQTLVLGLRDYVGKNGFPGVLIGMSGGIDSALSAAIAVDALGADKVRAYMMPSPYTSKESIDDAAECSALLGIEHGSISIAPAMQAFDAMLGGPKGVAAENIQARARGLVLMALSNAGGQMVLSTGNKSEMSVGYATLYGDMCGGYNVLKDVYKTTVFELVRWRNEQSRVIPERIITKPPSAELRPDQKDEDSLPPYPVLDDILFCLVEEEMDFEAIVTRGHDPATVARVWQMLDRAEYKRRQAAPGVKIGRKAFGRDRRYPIVNKFRDDRE